MTWSDYKRNIDLREYVIYKGFEFVKHKSTAHWKVYRNNSTEELIAIFTNKSIDNLFYINLKDSSDKGDLITFEMNHINNIAIPGNNMHSDYVAVARAFDEYLGISNKPQLSDFERKIEAKKKTDIFNYFLYDSKPINNSPYLESRGLTKETYLSKLFASRIVHTKPIWNKNGKVIEEKEFRIAFPIYYKHDIVGLDIRYQNGTKLFAQNSNKENGFWSSEFHPNYNILCIGESPIDCMSHYQLYEGKDKNKLCYISSGGHPTSNFFRNVESIIKEEQGVGKVILINDNDKAGQLFNLRFIEQVFKGFIYLQVSQVNNSKIDITIDITEYSRNSMNEFLERLREYNQKETSIFKTYSGEEFNDRLDQLKERLFSTKLDETNSNYLHIYCPNITDALYNVNVFLSQKKLPDFDITISRSNYKDWNEDLMNSKTK